MDSICQFSGLMQYLALHLDWLFTLCFLLCSCSQFFTVSCHRCRLTHMLAKWISGNICSPRGMGAPASNHPQWQCLWKLVFPGLHSDRHVHWGGKRRSSHASVLLCIGVKFSTAFRKVGSGRGSHVALLLTGIWNLQLNPRFHVRLLQSEMAFSTCGRCTNTQ